MAAAGLDQLSPDPGAGEVDGSPQSQRPFLAFQ